MAAQRGLRQLGVDDALQRRCGLRRRRGPGPDPPRRVRPGRRCPGRWVLRPPPGRRAPAVLRHGRHDGQELPDRQRRARPDERVRGRPHLPLQEGLRLPRIGPLRRPRRDRCRWWEPGAHRLARSAQGRARVGRRRSRPGVLRARRDQAGGDRRRPDPRDARRRVLPRRRDGPRPRRLPGCARRARRSARTVGGGGCGRRPRTGQPEHGRRVAHARRRARRRPARDHRPRLRRCRPGPRLRCRRAARIAAGRLPGQRQRAVRVRHAGHPGAHRPRPEHGPHPGQD